MSVILLFIYLFIFLRNCVILLGHTFDGFKILLFNYEVTISQGLIFNLAEVSRQD